MTLRSNGRSQGDRLVEGEPSTRARAVRDASPAEEPTDAVRADAAAELAVEEPEVDQVRVRLGRVADHIRELHRELAEFDASRREDAPVVVPVGIEPKLADEGEPSLGEGGPESAAVPSEPVVGPYGLRAELDADLRAAVESEAESLRALAAAEARSDAAAIRAEAERDAAEMRVAAEEAARQIRAAETQAAAELSAEVETLAARLSDELVAVRADAERLRAEAKQEAERVLADAHGEAQELRRRMIAGARAEAEREASGARVDLAEGVRLAANSAITRITRGQVQDLEELTSTLEQEPPDADTVQDAIAELGLAAAVLEQSIARLATALRAHGADRVSRSAD